MQSVPDYQLPLPAQVFSELVQALIHIRASEIEQHLFASADQFHRPVILFVHKGSGVDVDIICSFQCVIVSDAHILHGYK